MTLQQLEYVVAIYHHKHFQKAAEACRVTQPTLSLMVQKLEEEFGVKIFDRKQKPIVPTEVGRLIIEQAEHMLEHAQRLKESVNEQQHTLSGVFRIAVLPTVAPYLIPRFFPLLTQKYPDLDLSISEMKTKQIVDALNHGEIDAGILANTSQIQDFDKVSLFYEQYFVYAAKNNHLHLLNTVHNRNLTKADLWLLDEGHCFREQLEQYCQFKSAQQSKQAYKLGSIETFMRIVESGIGATFIPELCTLQLNANQKELVRPFAVPVPTREIILVVRKDFVRHSLLKMLVEEIRSSVPPSMLKLTHAQKQVI